MTQILCKDGILRTATVKDDYSRFHSSFTGIDIERSFILHLDEISIAYFNLWSDDTWEYELIENSLSDILLIPETIRSYKGFASSQYVFNFVIDILSIKSGNIRQPISYKQPT